MRIKDFQLGANTDPIGIRVNHSIEYISELIYLRLATTKVEGDYGKLVISLVRSGIGHTHGLVTLVSPVCEVSIERDDLSDLLAIEPVRRPAVWELIDEGIGFVRQAHPQGADELRDLCRTALASPPPYRFEVTRSRMRHGRLGCRVFYAFGPDFATIELEVDEPGEPIQVMTVRQAEHFVPWSTWVPDRIRSVGDGLAFEDRFGRQTDLIPLPRR